jgi:dipeptidyl-peptidase 4
MSCAYTLTTVCIVKQGSENPHDLESHKYPFAGGVNPVVNLSVVTVRPLCPALLNPLHKEASSSSSSDGAAQKDLYHQLPPLLHLPHIDNSNRSFLPSDPSLFPVQDVLDRHARREDNYIGRVGWWPDGSIMVQLTNRTQTCLQLLRVEATAPHASQVLLTESRASGAWINLHDMWHPLSLQWRPPTVDDTESGGGGGGLGDFYFLWGSERSGFMQLYLYHYDASSSQALVMGGAVGALNGSGPEAPGWVVDDIVAVDEERSQVYFHANKHIATEKHLFVASMDSSLHGECKRITLEPGWHDVTMDLASGRFVDVFSSSCRPPTMTLHSIGPFVKSEAQLDVEISVQQLAVVVSNDPTSSPCSVMLANTRTLTLLPRLVIPEFHTVETPGVEGGLRCCMYRPDPAVYGEGPFPCAVSCYGGPHVQRVTNTWVSWSRLPCPPDAIHAILQLL